MLSLLFGQPERSFGTVELIELAGSGRGAVQRELERLLKSGLVSATAVGTQRRYQANANTPIFRELRSLIQKTLGIPAAVRRSLQSIEDKIALAVLYGSVAKHSDTAESDVDVLIVSDALTLEEAFAALEGAERELGRRVSPTLYTTKEFRDKRRSGQPFVTKVMKGEHIVLVGNEDGIQAAR